MKNRLIIKTWVWGFYKTYAGFLFVLFLLFFGFIRGQEHLSIAQFLVGDIKNLIYPLGVFLLYAVLPVFFSWHFFQNSKNRFLGDLVCLRGLTRYRIIWKEVQRLLLPATLYGLFLVGVAVFSRRPATAVVLILFFIGLHAALTLLFDHMLIHPSEKVYGLKADFSFRLGGKWSFTAFLIKYLVLSRSLSFILTKILAIFNLLIFSLLIPTVDYLERFLGIAIFMAVLSNGLLPYEMFHFSFRKFGFLRNLPIRRSILYLQIWITLLVLLLPEIIFIYRNFLEYLPPFFLTTSFLAALSLLVLFFSGQLVFSPDQSYYTSGIFWTLLFIIFYLLFDLPVTILLIILLFSSYYLFYHYFYRHESIFTIQSDR